MSRLNSDQLEQEARSAGYSVVAVEQLRSNRVLLTLSEDAGRRSLVLVQLRHLISAADVHDLADISRLRSADRFILLARSGKFSPAAHQTLAELRDPRLSLCTSLPPASGPEAVGNQQPAVGNRQSVVVSP